CIGTLRPRVPHPLPTRRSSDLLGNDAVPLCGDHHSVIGVEPWGDAGVTPPHPDVALGDLSTSLTRGGPGLGHLSHRNSPRGTGRSEEHTSELQSRENLVCRLLP